MKKTTTIALFFLLALWINGKTHSRPIIRPAAGNIADGMYTIMGVGSGRCLDIPNGSCREGAPLQIFDCDQTAATNSQKFNVVADGSGNYTISPAHSDLCLEVSGDQDSSQPAIQQNACSPGKISQKWAMSQYGDNLEIRTAGGNQCMEVMHAFKKNFAQVTQHSCNNATSQRWKLSLKTLNENGVICRSSAAHPERECYGLDGKQTKTFLGKTLTKARCEEACAASKMVSCQWEGSH